MSNPNYEQHPNVNEIPCPEAYHYEWFTASYTTPTYRSANGPDLARYDANAKANEMILQISANIREYLKNAKCKGTCERQLIYISNATIAGPQVHEVKNPRHQWEIIGGWATVSVSEYLIIGCEKPIVIGGKAGKVGQPSKEEDKTEKSKK